MDGDITPEMLLSGFGFAFECTTALPSSSQARLQSKTGQAQARAR